MHLLGDSVILLALEYSSRELNLSTLNHTSITHCRFQEIGRHCKLGKSIISESEPLAGLLGECRPEEKKSWTKKDFPGSVSGPSKKLYLESSLLSTASLGSHDKERGRIAIDIFR